VDRYSFIVMDSHHLLFASLPAHPILAVRGSPLCRWGSNRGDVYSLAAKCFGQSNDPVARPLRDPHRDVGSALFYMYGEDAETEPLLRRTPQGRIPG
jgi:hypothetical protein